MRASRFNKVVTVQSVSTGHGTLGGQSKTWTALATDVWAWVDDARTGHRTKTDKGGEKSVQGCEIGIRYVEGVVPDTCRVLYDGRYYAVKGVAESPGTREYLILDCEKGPRYV